MQCHRLAGANRSRISCKRVYRREFPALTVSAADEALEAAAGVVAAEGGVLLTGAEWEGVPVGVADWLGTALGDLI